MYCIQGTLQHAGADWSRVLYHGWALFNLTLILMKNTLNIERSIIIEIDNNVVIIFIILHRITLCLYVINTNIDKITNI